MFSLLLLLQLEPLFNVCLLYLWIEHSKVVLSMRMDRISVSAISQSLFGVFGVLASELTQKAAYLSSDCVL